MPENFVYVEDQIPSIIIDLRYCSENNFVGEIIDGYEAETVILTQQATKALKDVQEKLLKDSLSLKIFDAYRPQRAVNHFRRWARDINDTLMKEQFYPSIDKRDLFKLQYIATKSRHSSGSTIDVTVVDLKTNQELDMGTSYDYFGEESGVKYNNITDEQIANRKFLQTIMLANGFRNYPQEWWHFTLRGEPFRDQYFDFVIK
ncbi:M15 family metallopeptidase [Urechidicola croceus]|uniref:M15 family metallopeptidase n=1 Tax=Urechidicola croceus TaxID=1850246 RepID=UPI0012EA8E84|nr:M15 family metallopeptidase [Urechidicola croceus]